jgi:high-affinity iron transporter
MRRAGLYIAALAATFVVLLTWARPAAADAVTWSDVVVEMAAILDDAQATFEDGDLQRARDLVNDAYYGYYEAKGFEKTVMAHISGQAATDAELEFTTIKKFILDGGPAADVAEHTATLKQMLADQASRLDGGTSAPALFVDALIIILREGLEAILVLGAIIAYLVKSGAKDRLPVVYAGAGLAVLASIGLAWAINSLTNLAGAPQEIIEGATVLAAMAMLMWVSAWIAGKSETAAWTGYIERSVGDATGAGDAAASGAPRTTSRSVVTLAAVAFLAVFREGAEVILLYQALQAGTDDTTPIWGGLGVGLVALAVVYVAFRRLSVRLPLKPFFVATSLLLALLAFSFAGSGIKELQEGDVVAMTPVAGVPSVDLLGVYPTVQTLLAQGVVLVAMAVLLTVSYRRARRRRTPATTATTAMEKQ